LFYIIYSILLFDFRNYYILIYYIILYYIILYYIILYYIILYYIEVPKTKGNLCLEGREIEDFRPET